MTNNLDKLRSYHFWRDPSSFAPSTLMDLQAIDGSLKRQKKWRRKVAEFLRDMAVFYNVERRHIFYVFLAVDGTSWMTRKYRPHEVENVKSFLKLYTPYWGCRSFRSYEHATWAVLFAAEHADELADAAGEP